MVQAGIAHGIEETLEVKNIPLLLRTIRLFEYCLLIKEQILLVSRSCMIIVPIFFNGINKMVENCSSQ